MFVAIERGRGWCRAFNIAMGSGVSVQRSASSMRTEIEKLRKRELDLQVSVHRSKRVPNKNNAWVLLTILNLMYS